MADNTYTQAQLDDLTDAEREAIESEEDQNDSDDDNTGEQDDSNDNDGDENETNEDGSGDTDGDNDDAAGEENAADAEGNEGDAGEVDPDEEEVRPLLKADMPDDYDAKIEAFGQERKDIEALFDDGELTAAEFMAKNTDIGKREGVVERDAFKSQIATDMENQRVTNEWLSTVDRFLKANTNYDPQQFPMRYKALDDTVRAVATENQDWSGQKVLDEANKRVSKEFGFAQSTKQDKKPRQKLPPTLNGVPSSDIEDTTNNGKYSHLDRMLEKDPQAYETALSKMSSSERDTYLASQ